MKTLLLPLLLVALAHGGLAAAKRDWKTGTLTETAHARESGSSPSVVIGASPAAAAIAAAQARGVTWQGFQIQGNGIRFQVMCPVRRNHSPNVTVHGAVKYALEKGKFYLLDEDGKEWEMTVLEKALLPPPPQP